MSGSDDQETASGPVRGGTPPSRWRWVSEHQVLAGLLAGAVLLAGGAGAAWLTVGDPRPDVPTARVERRALDGSVLVRGTVTTAQTVQVTAPAPGAGGAVRAVVTGLPVRTGQTVAAGRVLVEISGRPVFALPGALPAYRDLRPGDRGADVTQLQKALRGLGLRTGRDRAGVFGPGTAAALTAFYASRGYTPLPARPDGDTRLAEVRNAVAAARRARQDAADALADARDRRAALPGGASAADRTAAGQAVAEARRRVRSADADLADARGLLTAEKAADGPLLPVSEVQYLQGFPAVVDAVPVAVGGLVTGSAMTVSADGMVVCGGLPAYQRAVVRPGQPVRIVSEAGRVSAGGTVVSVADVPVRQQAAVAAQDGSAQDGSAQDGPAQDGSMRQGAVPGRPVQDSGRVAPAADPAACPVVVRPDHQLDPGMEAQQVLLSVQAPPSRGSVLAVPAPAIRTGGDGRAVVTVYRKHRERTVEVVPGASGGGWTEIRPLDDGAVREGDRVVLDGADRTGTGPATAAPFPAPSPAAPGPASAGRRPGPPAAVLTPGTPAARPSRAAGRHA
ncbi:peptidoglycan-binding protein [Streptomyces sp. NPDC001380]|uniref:peptidoglycan-binding protein n=1 Tax=Streptomyces sp. NPDC001380 TaxID=3364566 RepID=UPI0036AD158E